MSVRRATVRIPPQRRSAARLLGDPVFGGMFVGKLFSGLGVWIHAVAATIFIYDETGSATAAGLVSVAQFVPPLLLTPFSGSLADRGNEWLQLMMGRILCTAGAVGLGAWRLVADDVAGWDVVPPVMMGSVMVGLGFALGGPIQHSLIPLMVRADELPSAMALNTAPMTVARILSPVIAAFVVAYLGAAEAFLIAGLMHFVYVVVLCFIILPGLGRPEAGADTSTAAGLRYVLADRPLLLMLLAVTAVGFGAEPTITLAPAMADELGGGEGVVGTLTTSVGFGAALGLFSSTPLARRTSQSLIASAGLGLMAGGLFIAMTGTWLATGVVGFAALGVGFSWAMASLGTLVQVRTQPRMRGRVMALWVMGFLGSRPLASVSLGGIADLVNVRVALLATALVMTAMTVLCRPSALRVVGSDVRDAAVSETR